MFRGAALMESLMNEDEQEKNPSRLSNQIVRFFMHTALAIGSWLGLMLLGYALNPPGVSQLVILILSLTVPLVVGFAVTRFRPDDMASVIWLVGLVWMLIVSLWILDMPTGPNACFQCDATEKLTRTFFSFPRPSGLIDNDGPFLGTWPAVALVGYSIGARFAFRRKG
jgi:hypothetical protein